MNVAALYDIHGNLPALRAVMDEIYDHGVDQIIVGGDVIPGPLPAETIDYLLSIEIPVEFILGNGETAVLSHIEGNDLTHLPGHVEKVVRWAAEQLHPEHVQLLLNCPKTLKKNIPGIGEVLFCHATPRDENEIFTRLTPEKELLPVFNEIDSEIVVCGHTHMQFDRIIGKVRVVNAGSLGMPVGKPGADWLLLSEGIAHKHSNYDLNEGASIVRKTDYPLAEEFALNILTPQSELEILSLYSHPAKDKI